MDKRVEVGLEAIKQAGNYLRSQFLKKHRVSNKKDLTVQLHEDLKSEEILLSLISKAFPKDSFFTEERDMKLNEDSVWIIDPLCGSYSYLRGVETWSISLAYYSDNRLQFGVVYQPYLVNVFYGVMGWGAFMNGQPIQPSKIKDIKNAFISIEHGVFNNRGVNLEKLISEMKRLRVGHGSGGELSYVASGFLDAVIKTDQTLMHFAGGRAIIEAAGGVFNDFSNNEAPIIFDKNKKINYIAASNKHLVSEILKVLSL